MSTTRALSSRWRDMASAIIDPTTHRTVGKVGLEQLRCSVHLEFEHAPAAVALAHSQGLDPPVICRLVGHGLHGPAEVVTIEETPAKAAGLAVMQYIHRGEGDPT